MCIRDRLYSQRVEERPGKRGGIFDQVAERALGLRREVVAVDVDAVDRLELLLAAFSRGANDRDAVPCGAQGRRFLPHTTVKRAGEILDEDEDSARFPAGLLRLLLQC